MLPRSNGRLAAPDQRLSDANGFNAITREAKNGCTGLEMVIFRGLTVTLSHYATVAITQQRRSARTNRRNQKFLKKGENVRARARTSLLHAQRLQTSNGPYGVRSTRRSGDLGVQQSGSVLAELTHSLEQT